MCQKEIGKERDVEIAEARSLHQDILARLMKGPSGGDDAMHRAQTELGLPFWCQWNLRHKKRATGEFMQRLKFAYLHLLEASVKRDLHALKIEQAKGADDASLDSLMAETETLLAKIAERVKA